MGGASLRAGRRGDKLVVVAGGSLTRRTSHALGAVSAFRGKADIPHAGLNVCFSLKADIRRATWLGNRLQ